MLQFSQIWVNFLLLMQAIRRFDTWWRTLNQWSILSWRAFTLSFSKVDMLSPIACNHARASVCTAAASWCELIWINSTDLSFGITKISVETYKRKNPWCHIFWFHYPLPARNLQILQSRKKKKKSTYQTWWMMIHMNVRQMMHDDSHEWCMGFQSSSLTLKYFSSFFSKKAAVGFLATNFDKIVILSCFQSCWYLRQFSRCLHSIQNHHPLVVP